MCCDGQEAIQREASLEGRLRTLRECVERTRAEAAASWELFVGEQRLLMRVHTLETMLAVGKQPDHHQLAQLLSDKRNYQVRVLAPLKIMVYKIPTGTGKKERELI